MNTIEKCNLCPRNCNVNRTENVGYCGVSNKIKVAKAMVHMWEEPSISGDKGSGAVFFSGCNLKCCFCQNSDISFKNVGQDISINELADIFLKLQDKGVHNINLVTGSHFVPEIIKALDLIKHKLTIPVVYNTSSYEKKETIKLLDGYVDVYLPDLKYKNSMLAKKYSNAPDYFEIATNAILEMHNQVGKNSFSDDGTIKKGMIIRHLIMPMAYKDSIEILNWIKKNLPVDDILVSIMSQYTPQGTSDFKELNRKIFTMEYDKVLSEVEKLGIKGYMQERLSANSQYTPDFKTQSVI